MYVVCTDIHSPQVPAVRVLDGQLVAYNCAGRVFLRLAGEHQEMRSWGTAPKADMICGARFLCNICPAVVCNLHIALIIIAGRRSIDHRACAALHSAALTLSARQSYRGQISYLLHASGAMWCDAVFLALG